MPEKVLKAIFILLFSVLGIVLSTQTEPLLTAVIPKKRFDRDNFGNYNFIIGCHADRRNFRCTCRTSHFRLFD